MKKLLLKTSILYFLAFYLFSACQTSPDQTGDNADDGSRNIRIRLNQVGFYPGTVKKAAVLHADQQDFRIVEKGTDKVVFTGTLSNPLPSPFSDKKTRMADFTSLENSGEYILKIGEQAESYPFRIEDDVFQPLAKASIKAFYFQRASAALPAEFAGEWARNAGHPDQQVEIHPSAASEQRPAGSKFASPKGWYDAGDYGKYIVNSGISTGTLLSLYEDFPTYFDTLSLNIPESTNQVPDLLDEIRWNLSWMLTMQDPNDGGVYHKLTTANFAGMVMPEQANAQRYFLQKSVTATYDFAAVTAQAARIYDKYNAQFPGLADSCRKASVSAWNWALQNPDQLYKQDELNQQYDPDVVTGAYGDGSATDEKIWAACELFVTTGDVSYLDQVELLPSGQIRVPGWPNVEALGYYTLLRNSAKVNNQQLLQKVKQALQDMAENLMQGMDNRAYQVVMGARAQDFVWGSSAVAANQGIALIQAYLYLNQSAYLKAALSNLDYLLGRNSTGYSFITGFGDKTPMHIHHRPSEADQVEAPVPGLLAGGPNPGQQDNEKYPSDVPDESYADVVGSYASNEIAINWNAPLVYLVSAMEALHNQGAF
jgi:endoglucanase